MPWMARKSRGWELNRGHAGDISRKTPFFSVKQVSGAVIKGVYGFMAGVHMLAEGLRHAIP